METRPVIIQRVLPFARKRGKSDKAMAQRNGGYLALRNLVAAGSN